MVLSSLSVSGIATNWIEWGRREMGHAVKSNLSTCSPCNHLPNARARGKHKLASQPNRYLTPFSFFFFGEVVGTMAVYPTNLQIVEPDQLEIQWSDGEVRRYRFSELRDSCPCATCREQRRAEDQQPADPLQLNVLSPSEAQPLRIESMAPVGNYAYSIKFTDGHDSGIFTLELLRDLGQPVHEE